MCTRLRDERAGATVARLRYKRTVCARVSREAWRVVGPSAGRNGRRSRGRLLGRGIGGGAVERPVVLESALGQKVILGVASSQ